MSSFPIPNRVLMGPGPSCVSKRVLAATAQPTIGHLDPVFTALMEETKNLLRYAFQTDNALTFPVSAPGSAGMEMCFANLVEPEDVVVVCENGVFGGRMIENVKRCGGVPIVVKDDWGRAVTPEKLEKTLNQHPEAKIVAFVHSETSTGAKSDAETLCNIAQKYDCLTIVDTVTSLGGIPLMVDEWGIDATYSGTQKCLSCPPGLSPVSFSEKATSRIKNRTRKVQSWFLDLSLVMDYWESTAGGTRSYHHTAPVNALYGLHEALTILKEEGLEAAWRRHSDMHMKLRTGLEQELDLKFIVPENERLPQLNSVQIPDGIDDAKARKHLLEKHNLEIGAGLGVFAGKVWRLGLMGESANQKNIDTCIAALKEVIA